MDRPVKDWDLVTSMPPGEWRVLWRAPGARSVAIYGMRFKVGASHGALTGALTCRSRYGHCSTPEVYPDPRRGAADVLSDVLCKRASTALSCYAGR